MHGQPGQALTLTTDCLHTIWWLHHPMWLVVHSSSDRLLEMYSETEQGQHQSKTPGWRPSKSVSTSISPGVNLLLDLTSNVTFSAFGLNRAATHTTATSALEIMGNRPTLSCCSAARFHVSTAVRKCSQLTCVLV